MFKQVGWATLRTHVAFKIYHSTDEQNITRSRERKASVTFVFFTKGMETYYTSHNSRYGQVHFGPNDLLNLLFVFRLIKNSFFAMPNRKMVSSILKPQRNELH